MPIHFVTVASCSLEHPHKSNIGKYLEFERKRDMITFLFVCGFNAVHASAYALHIHGVPRSICLACEPGLAPTGEFSSFRLY